MTNGKSTVDIDMNRVLFGSDHESVEEAILADIISGIPVVGEITDFFRVTNANTKHGRALQALDTLTDPIPIIGQITFTNTALYLDKTGQIDLSFIEDALNTLQFLNRKGNR